MESISNELTVEKIKPYYNLSIQEAAKKLGICETLLKKFCRRNGIKRWPHRMIRSIENILATLKDELYEAKTQAEKNRIEDEIKSYYEKYEIIVDNPNIVFQSIVSKNNLQAFSKKKLKKQKQQSYPKENSPLLAKRSRHSMNDLLEAVNLDSYDTVSKKTCLETVLIENQEDQETKLLEEMKLDFLTFVWQMNNNVKVVVPDTVSKEFEYDSDDLQIVTESDIETESESESDNIQSSILPSFKNFLNLSFSSIPTILAPMNTNLSQD
jgi:hypothetical protein